MENSNEFSKYMSSFFMDFKKDKFFKIYSNSNEKFTLPHKNIMIIIGAILVLLYVTNLLICIHSRFLNTIL